VSQAAPLVALVGNPNTGKTTLFNRLTGQNARVGNYAGVTVERREGTARLTATASCTLVDVPGTSSLNARSAEEEVAIRSTLGLHGEARPDVVVVVVDATQLTRSLYLVVQLLELGAPVVLALNLIDEADPPPDPAAVGAAFGVPCAAISARQGTGVAKLRALMAEAVQAPPRPVLRVPYPAAVEADIDAIAPLLPTGWPARGMALWALLSIDEDDELADVPPALRAAVLARHAAARAAGRDLDAEVITARYALLEARQPDIDHPPIRNLTDAVDRVLLHPVAGFALFLLMMGVVFQSLFSWADPAIGLVEDAFGALGAFARDTLPPGFFTDLLVEGVIGGVGNVLVFLPQILLLFFFIGLLEDSGYMARVAYLMDRIMRSLGLHGRAFVPMMSGYACAVPAILATRTMERRRDRLLTMMVVPLMSCSARLPVYTLIIGALFPPRADGLPVQGALMVAMYLFSTVVTLLAAAVLGRTILKGPKVPLILELPPYRRPDLRSVLRMMWERSQVFLTDAGTVILACTIVLWGLLSYPALPEPAPDAPDAEVAAWRADSLAHSAAGRVGKAIEPVIAPLGFDWKIGVGLVGAFAAREVFVSTMGLVYGVGEEATEDDPGMRERLRAETRPDGTPTYTPLVGLSLMVFFALACQCMSTLAVVKRETGGYAWPTFLFVYMTALAWVSSFILYQGGRLLGFA
jgi:ferrous iron transport protein B